MNTKIKIAYATVILSLSGMTALFSYCIGMIMNTTVTF